ncbi:MAG TPA: hypothetical protein VIL64_01025 [Solirubrobacteraceae bacterium]
MIVRILTEGQYNLPDDLYDELNSLDNRTVTAVEASDEELFYDTFRALLDLVRDKGTPLADDDLSESSVILPPPDLTLVEAEEEFTGEGLLPD